jgi:hypothetical protein
VLSVRLTVVVVRRRWFAVKLRLVGELVIGGLLAGFASAAVSAIDGIVGTSWSRAVRYIGLNRGCVGPDVQHFLRKSRDACGLGSKCAKPNLPLAPSAQLALIHVPRTFTAVTSNWHPCLTLRRSGTRLFARMRLVPFSVSGRQLRRTAADLRHRG